uniref:ABC transporter domain-containing protein n=1 Tax=Quercus lobata TaxID=97700 RepID=A0A7N2LPQ9_QUELO
MESGHSSFRLSSSSIWGDTTMEVFSKSAQEDDEEALKWASLHRKASNGCLFLCGFLGLGIAIPTSDVRFEHLNIEAEANVGIRALPTFLNFSVNIMESFLNYLHILPSKKKHLSILQDVSGVIKPGRMTLLLSPPSSGKTMLLLALAGVLDPDLKFSRKVTYNGHEMHEFVPQRTAAYVSQQMLAELARREKEENIEPDPDLDIYIKAVETKGQEVNVVTDYIIKVLGLEVCADTLIGNQMLRGISGGQKKRVTMDCSIKQYVHILNGTAVISLLQPAPETYDLFDDIILISDGQIVYQGPCEQVFEFFESMGFKCPERKGVADFLQEVTSRKDQEQYWEQKDEPYNFVTVKEFAEAFQSFHVGQKLVDELATQFDKAKSHPAALTTRKYGVENGELLKACLSREILLMKRNSFTEMHRNSLTDGGIYTGALFYSVVVVMFNGAAEINMTVARLPVFFKQRKLLFYPPWAYSLPSWIIQIPITCVEVAVWVFITYYVIGFDPSAGRFFRQYFPLLLANQMVSALFCFMGAIGRGDVIISSTFGSFALIMLIAMGGFVLSRALGKPQFVKSEEPQCNGQDYRSRGNNSSHQRSIAENGYEIRRSSITSSPSSTSIDASVEVSQNRKRGIILPFGQHTITFNEITYSVDMPQEMKNQGVTEDKLVLLKGVSGALWPGVLTALMGVNGAEARNICYVSGYCEQNNIHSPHVTAYESLIYSEWLRLSPDVNSQKRKMFVEEVMELVELKLLRQALVGLPGVNGLSTEQRKRLTIAVELVANPTIIFMDEPTSGLDARAVAIVMRTVRNTVDTGRTVVCTIHQPSIDIFEAFDELFLMKHGGQEIYVGPLGSHSCHLIQYFEGIGGVGKIKDGYNPATWMLEVTSSAHETTLGIDFANVYRNSELYRTKQQDLFNAMGSMYAAVLFIGVRNSNSVQPVVAVERTVFYRERAAGMYSALPYAFAQVLIEVPNVFVQAMVYVIIVYVLIGFEWTAPKFFWYLFFMYFSLLYFTFYGMMTVASIPIWWRWYSWACPPAWTLYGLVASQFGDKDILDTGETVEDFVRDYFGFNHDFLVVVAVVIVGFGTLFAFIFAVAIKLFKFQRM